MSLTRVVLFFSLLMCISLGEMFAQRAAYKPQVHELSLQLGSVNSIPTLSDEYKSGSPLSLHPLNGIRYTYHYSISDGFRVGAFRRKANFFSAEDELRQYQNINSDKVDWDFHLGYKRMYHMGSSQIFGGADLTYSLTRVDLTADALSGVARSDAYKHNGYGISGFMGYSYFFNTHLSLTFEGEVYYSKQSNLARVSSQEPIPITLNDQDEIGFNASVYLNFHLVKMKKRCTCPKGR